MTKKYIKWDVTRADANAPIEVARAKEDPIEVKGPLPPFFGDEELTFEHALTAVDVEVEAGKFARVWIGRKPSGELMPFGFQDA